MADETNTTPQQGGRPGGNREPGGFRIRLSDNEMRAARALQDAFRLRSTVAVLGFSVRTLAQMLEEGKLDELVAQQRSEGGDRPPRGAGARGQRAGEGERGTARGQGSPRIDPFARPSRPVTPQPEAEEALSEEQLPTTETSSEETVSEETSSEGASSEGALAEASEGSADLADGHDTPAAG
jgi:hypothetical protein